MTIETKDLAPLPANATLADVNKAVGELSAQFTEEALKELATKYGGVVYDVSTTEGMDSAKVARRELRELRVAVDNRRKSMVSVIVDRQKAVNALANGIKDRISALEEPIDQQIDAEEARREERRQEKIRAERAAAAKIQNALDAMRDLPVAVVGMSADTIAAAIESLRSKEFGDMPEAAREEADKIRSAAVSKLVSMHAERVQADAEKAELAKQREALNLQREKDERINLQRGAVQTIRDTPAKYEHSDVAQLDEAIAALPGSVDLDEFDESLRGDVAGAVVAAVDKLQAMRAARLKADADAKTAQAVKAVREQIDAMRQIPIALQTADLEQVIKFHKRLVDAEGFPDELPAEVRAEAEQTRGQIIVWLSTQATTLRDRAAAFARQQAEELAERDRAIKTVSLLDAAREASDLLKQMRQGTHLVVVKLDAAIARAETATAKTSKMRKPVKKAATKKSAKKR